ncbi:unnamed protein product [Triticum turgidum subsp. durum]|uniref:Wall-associated receptor kinase galacturonan-binding domain-containing protein n=1 Tax=Triticum turgidum subsp. durum TaxID=4567 RepID=A0A9R0Q0I4_TRITD|nr:unnamed protein product [Triticum turgidum subsp. durum]
MPTAFLLTALLLAAAAATNEATGSLVVTHGCATSCGGVDIPYPFGIGGGCFRKGFEIECINSSHAELAGTSIRVMRLSSDRAESLVMLPIGWMCFNASSPSEASDFSYAETEMNKDGVYRISNTHNMLVVLGCNTFAYTASGKTQGGTDAYTYYTGCMSFCNNSASAQDGLCAGVGCCRLDIPPGLTGNYFKFRAYNHSTMMDYSPCDYAFLVDRNNYTFRRSDLRMDTSRTSPVWLDWAIRGNGSVDITAVDVLSCTQAPKTGQYACVSAYSDCVDSTNGPGYNCKCSEGYEGNAYLTLTMLNIDECAHPAKYPCYGICKDTQGSYQCPVIQVMRAMTQELDPALQSSHLLHRFP